MIRLYTQKQYHTGIRAAVLKVEEQIQARIDAAVAAAVAPLLARIAELEQEIARLKKNSSNSSKPPSSDIVKPPKITVTHKKGKRRKGAQPGHPRHERTPFTEEEIDRQVTYERQDLDPKEWEPLDEWDIVQQVELKDSPVEIIEHRARHYRHRRTQQVLCAALPEEVRAAGLVGPRLSAYIAFLKGACHMSYTTIQTLLADVFDVHLSTGQLAKITTGKVSAALAMPYSASSFTPRSSSPSSPPRASSRPTTSPNRPSATSSSTARSPRARAATKASVGPNGSGRF
jgi:transposase/uncharacterized small protein (DUF1192 family)